jgi:hypothetical protein
MNANYENLKERLTDMSVLASTRTPADALQYIEELEAENKRLRLEEADAWATTAAAIERIKKLEAKLAKAMDALDAIKLYSFDDDACSKARTTLAELKREK